MENIDFLPNGIPLRLSCTARVCSTKWYVTLDLASEMGNDLSNNCKEVEVRGQHQVKSV